MVRLDDQCVPKWIRGCEMLELPADLMVTEHLLNTLPLSVKIWVEERRCQELGRGKEEAAQLADDYIRARKQTKPTKQSEDKAIDPLSNAITVGKKVMYPGTALIVRRKK